MSLLIRSSQIHESGCYTSTPIKAGDYIVEYTGPRITIDEANDRYERCERTYLFGLDCGTHVIDGNGIAAFINHSCDPNCEADEHYGQVWIIASRDIAAGEELTYDYNLYDGEPEDESRCLCGAKTCRGTLYSEEEMEKRAKLSASGSVAVPEAQPAA
jgi:hypothetical protein